MSLNRDKLARVLGMIGSRFDGEAPTAARRAHEVVTNAGLSWEQVLDNHDTEMATEACRRLVAEIDALREQLARLKAEAARGSGVWADPRTKAEKIHYRTAHTELLNAWEKGFLENISGSRRGLSPRQEERLNELVDKVRRIATLGGRAA